MADPLSDRGKREKNTASVVKMVHFMGAEWSQRILLQIWTNIHGFEPKLRPPPDIHVPPYNKLAIYIGIPIQNQI